MKKGLPFRSAYKISGELVRKCIAENKVLEELSLDEFKAHSELIEDDIYSEIDLLTCVEKRISLGGTSVSMVERQIEFVKNKLSI